MLSFASSSSIMKKPSSKTSSSAKPFLKSTDASPFKATSNSVEPFSESKSVAIPSFSVAAENKLSLHNSRTTKQFLSSGVADGETFLKKNESHVRNGVPHDAKNGNDGASHISDGRAKNVDSNVNDAVSASTIITNDVFYNSGVANQTINGTKHHNSINDLYFSNQSADNTMNKSKDNKYNDVSLVKASRAKKDSVDTKCTMSTIDSNGNNHRGGFYSNNNGNTNFVGEGVKNKTIHSNKNSLPFISVKNPLNSPNSINKHGDTNGNNPKPVSKRAPSHLSSSHSNPITGGSYQYRHKTSPKVDYASLRNVSLPSINCCLSHCTKLNCNHENMLSTSPSNTHTVAINANLMDSTTRGGITQPVHNTIHCVIPHCQSPQCNMGKHTNWNNLNSPVKSDQQMEFPVHTNSSYMNSPSIRGQVNYHLSPSNNILQSLDSSISRSCYTVNLLPTPRFHKNFKYNNYPSQDQECLSCHPTKNYQPERPLHYSSSTPPHFATMPTRGSRNKQNNSACRSKSSGRSSGRSKLVQCLSAPRALAGDSDDDNEQYEEATDTSYEKACGSDRRGSAPATPILGGSRTHQMHHMRNDTTQYNNNGGSSTPSSTRFANFFSKRTIKNLPLKRTKSVTKLERSKRANNSSLLSSNHSIQSNTIHNNSTSNPLYQHPHQQPLDTSTQNLYHHNQQPSHHLSNTNLGGAAADGGAMARLRSSQSHESLLATHNQQMMNTLDLMAGESVIKPLHESILGQKFCFQISSPGGTRYYSCRTAEERDKWVESLRRAVNPQSDNKSRVHNSIKITIVEAKGITPKKKYFCELQLDETLYARTSSKQKQEMCFWGEPFEFKCLPAIHTVTVSLYREGEKRRKKDKQTLLGRVNIPVSTVSGRSMVEKWYPVEGANMSRSSKGGNANSKDNTPSLRIKCAFQSVHILPIQMYNDFHQYLMSSYSTLCALIEPVVSVATKADVATTLVHLTQHNHTATAFIADIVVAEIDKNDDAHLIFRGNSLATKAMEAFMKLVGERYLHDTLRPAIAHILVTEVDCEVDPKKVSNEAAIPKNRQNLISIVQMTWTKIIQSRVAFPPELRQCFVLFRERLQSMNKENLSDKLISASIFLRFLCPAILNPSLFNIIQELPDEKATRNLTLVAKTLQTLANFTKFQGKEQFMEFMNDFIEEEQSQMKSFLKKISTRSNIDQRALEYSGEIDLGIQLSVLQTLLSECSPNMKPDLSQESYKEKLQRIIKELDHAKSNPNNDLVQSLVSRGATSTTTTTAATIIDHQRLEKERQRLQPLAQNVIRYNDPTAITMCSNFPTEVQYNKGNVYNYHGAGGCSNSPMPPNVNDYTEIPCHQSNKINASPGPHNSSTPDQEPSTPRSSTLPRNTYLMGSGRKPPAMDLHTSDDYVHYSALGVESNEGQIHNKSPHPVGHSFSQSHVPSDSPSHQAGSSTPVQHSQQPPNHHQHFHNHMARYNNNNPLPYSGGGSNYGSPQQYGHPHAVTGHHNNGNTDDSLNSSHDYDQNCTADTETNMKGSQTSISQLSNIASSGYQSFAYSQSSSPVDPVITDVTNNNNNVNLNKNSHNNQKGNIGSNTSNNISNSLLSDPISVAQMPQITQVMQPPPQVAALAFNNPMYHLNNCSNSPRPNSNKIHPSQALAHHFLINGSSIQQQRAYPLMHSQSSHATNYSSSRDAAVHSSNNHLNHHCSSSLSSAHSVEDLGCAKVNLSGSDDTSSLVSTTSTPPPQKDMPRISNYSQTGNGGQALTHLNQHNNSNNNIFKSGAPRTNPRFAPPPPPWQQQQQQNLHHSSITNIPSSTNSNNTQRNNKSHLDHHHSTSDLLSSSSHPHPRSTSHKNSRRQSAEFAPSRQRLLLRNNNKYDSTSDDTSSDETAGNHHSNPPYSRAKNTNNNAALHGVPVNVPAAFSHRASNSNRVSDSKSLEEYENEILTLKRMLDNLQIELKEHQEQQLSGDSSISNNSSPISSSVSSNTPPSPAPTSPPITTKQPNHQYTSHQYDRGNSSEARQSPDNNDLRSSPVNDRRTSGASTTTNIRISPPSFSVPSTSSQAQQQLSVAADSIEDPSADSAQQTKQLQELLKKLLAVQSEKDAVIAAQKQHITSLDDTNNRLRTAYQHLTKHINVMDLESANPETSAAVAAASATAIAAVGSAATDGSLDTTTPSSSYNRAGHIANTTEYSSGSKC
uniref:Ras GTPase-activating protein n=1 Tax=Hirondellea gigas TaxID=1518452 RepID=A0A6A7FUG8_9CRUS